MEKMALVFYKDPCRPMNRVYSKIFVEFALALLLICHNSTAFTIGKLSLSRPFAILAAEQDVDPNFEAHLMYLLASGSRERSSPDLAKELRERYIRIANVKRKAAGVMREIANEELAVELEDLADELSETTDRFVELATTWDAWNRPSPDLAKELRLKYDLEKRQADPNFEAHLPALLKKGMKERPSVDLPSELRLLKYKTMSDVQKLAAGKLKDANDPTKAALAEELEDIADEISESHDKFVELAATMRAVQFAEKSKSTR